MWCGCDDLKGHRGFSYTENGCIWRVCGCIAIFSGVKWHQGNELGYKAAIIPR